MKKGLITAMIDHREILKTLKRIDGVARVVHRMKVTEIWEKGQIINREA